MIASLTTYPECNQVLIDQDREYSKGHRKFMY